MIMALEEHLVPASPLAATAWKRFEELGGFPDKRRKGCQYLPFRKMSQLNRAKGNYRLVWENVEAPVAVLPFSEALITYGAFLEHHLKQLIKEETDSFALLNLAGLDQAYFVYVPPGKEIKTPLHIHLHVEKGGLIQPHYHIFLGKHSSIEVRTTLHGDLNDSWINESVDLTLEEGARCTHLQPTDAPWHFRSLRATQKRDTILNSLHTTQGGQCVRNRTVVDLVGENSEAHLFGLWNGTGERETHTHVLVKHHAPECRSRQYYKGVLDDQARSSFEGKIYVEREAQKTDAYQMNNNLLLGQKAHADSQPNLEIFADDVKASHGATVGQLEAEHLFYLKTRGISEDEAKKLLVEAFCEDVLQAFSDAQRHFAWKAPTLS